MESDGGEDQRRCHTRDRPAGDPATTSLVDDDEGDQSEDEAEGKEGPSQRELLLRYAAEGIVLGNRKDESNDQRVLESNTLEQGGSVVGQSVEPATPGESVNALAILQQRTRTYPQNC